MPQDSKVDELIEKTYKYFKQSNQETSQEAEARLANELADLFGGILEYRQVTTQIRALKALSLASSKLKQKASYFFGRIVTGVVKV